MTIQRSNSILNLVRTSKPDVGKAPPPRPEENPSPPGHFQRELKKVETPPGSENRIPKSKKEITGEVAENEPNAQLQKLDPSSKIETAIQSAVLALAALSNSSSEPAGITPPFMGGGNGTPPTSGVCPSPNSNPITDPEPKDGTGQTPQTSGFCPSPVGNGQTGSISLDGLTLTDATGSTDIQQAISDAIRKQGLEGAGPVDLNSSNSVTQLGATLQRLAEGNEKGTGLKPLSGENDSKPPVPGVSGVRSLQDDLFAEAKPIGGNVRELKEMPTGPTGIRSEDQPEGKQIPTGPNGVRSQEGRQFDLSGVVQEKIQTWVYNSQNQVVDANGSPQGAPTAVSNTNLMASQQTEIAQSQEAQINAPNASGSKNINGSLKKNDNAIGVTPTGSTASVVPTVKPNSGETPSGSSNKEDSKGQNSKDESIATGILDTNASTVESGSTSVIASPSGSTQPTAINQASKTSDSAPATQLSNDDIRTKAVETVNKHIQTILVNSVRNEVVVKMQPEALGTITISIKRELDGLDASVSASNEHVREALRQGRPDIIQHFQQKGYGDLKVNVASENFGGKMGQSQDGSQNSQSNFQNNQANQQSNSNHRSSYLRYGNDTETTTKIDSKSTRNATSGVDLTI